MPYAPDFPANEVWSHKIRMPCGEYAFSEYMPFMRVDCIDGRHSKISCICGTAHLRPTALL